MSTDTEPVQTGQRGLPALRVGFLAGLTGILCCVGPTVLALFGIVSAGTAYVWANDLYDGYAWWFRLAGLAVLVLLVAWVLERRNQCNLRGLRSNQTKLGVTLGAAVATYAILYAATTWLGTFA